MDENMTKDTEEIEAEVVNEEESVGNIKIAPEVVTTIAGIATNEIEGVAGMYSTIAGGIAEILGAKKHQSKGVKVEITDKNVVIDLYIIVDYGVRIPELAWEIQENVKNSVETMTGLTVSGVNINVTAIMVEKEQPAQVDIEEETEE